MDDAGIATACQDPLNMISGVGTAWTTANAGEAMPGVLYPLGWTFWGDGVNAVIMRVFQSLGLLSAREAAALDPSIADHRFFGIFAGRACVNVSLVRAMGDRIPGSTGDAIEKQMFGGLNSGLVNEPMRRRYPAVVARLPIVLTQAIRSLRSARIANERYWHEAIASPPQTLDQARRLLLAATGRFESTMIVHLQNTLIAQALYDRTSQLHGADDLADHFALSTGYGAMEETAVLQGIWEMAHGLCTMDTFLNDHGYHGPREGDITGRSWREDHAPILSMMDLYCRVPIERSPREVERARVDVRRAAERRLLAGLTPAKRPFVALLLRWTAQAILRRQVGKVAFLYAIDEARVAARSAGQIMHAQGIIESPDDIAFLTVDELTARPTRFAQLRDLIAQRNEIRCDYLKTEIPRHWTGNPIHTSIAARVARSEGVGRVSGLPVSGGVAEGTARVVTDPVADGMDEGDILVCSTTDPSWVPLMFLAGAVVVDIGGPMSHAAILARELGIPCVVNTIDGSQRLRDGDPIRVDGSTGHVVAL